MASENYVTDEFESWMTFSPKQRPSELPEGISSNTLENSSSNSLSVQSSCASPFDSGCRSPDRDYIGNISPLSPSLDQGQRRFENFVPNIDSAFVPNYSVWYNPILSPSLDMSQNFLDDELKHEWKTEVKTSNFGALSATQKKRREQNRAAQRNFRQRKEVHLKHLETTIVDAEARRTSLQQDNEYLQRELARLGIENNRLRRGPPCSRHKCAIGERPRLESSNSGHKVCDKNLGNTLQIVEDEKTIKIIAKTQTSEGSEESIAPGRNGQRGSSSTHIDEDDESKLEKRLPVHVDNNPESPLSCKSNVSSANDSTGSSCTTRSSSRTGSMTNVGSETSSNSLFCGNCNEQRSSKDRINEVKARDMEYQNNARVLICAQETLKNIQSHELFQKGFVDIEQLLCALRQIVRYYEGTAVFDRTELESIVRECAKDGRNDALI